MAINSSTVAAVRHTAGVANWTADKLKVMNRKTKKLITMNGAFHPQADVDRLYAIRREEEAVCLLSM